MGFEKPSEIQAEAIPPIIQGKDIIGQAQTGSGKTAAFAIPCIEGIDQENKATQALILCPTRELAIQVTGEFEKLSKYHRSISSLAVYGGQNISIQLKALKKGAQIVIGTPGRIMDHMERGTLKLNQVKYLVLDEADQMLDMGFEEDMETILTKTPTERQTVMFSATMSKTLIGLMKQYQNKPKHINTIGKGKQSKQINQLYYHINKASKPEALKRLIAYHKVNSALIFCNTKMMVDELAKELTTEKYSVAVLHGDIDQKKRDKVMQAFREGAVELLIATDVAARGLDIDDLEAVVNYDLPRYDQDYVHRIGRTGRAGNIGLALSLVTNSELNHLERIARKNNMVMERAKVPRIQDLDDTNFETIKSLLENTQHNRKSLKKYSKLLNNLELYEYSDEELMAILLKTLLERVSKTFQDDISFEPERVKRKSFGGKSKSGRFSKKGPRNSRSSSSRNNRGDGKFRGKSSGNKKSFSQRVKSRKSKSQKG